MIRAMFGVLVGGGLAAGMLGAAPDDSQLPLQFRKLVPLCTRLAPPEPGEWLAAHREPGQTFRQFVKQTANRVRRDRNVIYVQRLGEFDSAQRVAFDAAAEYLGVFFGLPVKEREPLPLSLIPAAAQRRHPQWDVEQVLTTYVLNEVLLPRRPSDAAAHLAFTTVDLWPGQGWNFVFGQASLSERVGVWSIHRFGDPRAGGEARALWLRRTLKLASHETGHMFSLMHCTYYECNMCGSNHLEEADRRPMWLCPHCLAKLAYATGVTPESRFRQLIEFCKKYSFQTEVSYYERSLEALRKP